MKEVGLVFTRADRELVSIESSWETEIPFSAKIFPNPVQNYLNIELNITNVAPVELTLVNQLGQNSYHTQIIPTNPFQTISIGHLAPGFYWCRLTMAEQQIIRLVLLY